MPGVRGGLGDLCVPIRELEDLQPSRGALAGPSTSQGYGPGSESLPLSLFVSTESHQQELPAC